jgi:hypothetical protein
MHVAQLAKDELGTNFEPQTTVAATVVTPTDDESAQAPMYEVVAQAHHPTNLAVGSLA